MVNEINVINLLNACSIAQQKANATGAAQIIRVNDYAENKSEKGATK